ncbi:MAG: hypothetical protein QOF06_2200 [Solirubrobacterales bacterium]|jgi:hypothetical protein|nr:hypothetical protein [Solirubrobacterales bacterium]
MTVAGICELVLEADDVEGLARFYRDLGLKLLMKEEDRYWQTRAEGVQMLVVDALAEDGDGA